MRWRSEVNNQLATSVFTGRHRVDVEPLDAYLHKTDHPSENPKTLLTYSASVDNISSLGIKRFLHYGIPRAKTVKKGPFSFSRNKKKNKAHYTVEPLLETDETNIADPDYKCENKHNTTSKDTAIIRVNKDGTSDISFQDINENINGKVIPYYEPDPDYEFPGSQHSPGVASSIDNITSPGTSFAGNASCSSSESEPEECPYLVRQRQMEMFAASNIQKRTIPTISRTYSTLNALDPTYVKGGDVKTAKASNKKKKKNEKDKDGSWKSFESSANSKSTDSKSKRSPLTNLFRKTSSAISKQLQSGNKKSKNHYSKSGDMKEGIYKTTIEVIHEAPNEIPIYSSARNIAADSKDAANQQSKSMRAKDNYRSSNTSAERRYTLDSMDAAYRARLEGPQNSAEAIYSNHTDFKHSTHGKRSEAVYDGHSNFKSNKFKAFDPPVFKENFKNRPFHNSSSYHKKDPYKSEYARPSDVKRQATLSSQFYGGSVDVFSGGLLEQIEFTKEPRRLGNYRGPDSKIYASHSMLHSKGHDNWGFH